MLNDCVIMNIHIDDLHKKALDLHLTARTVKQVAVFLVPLRGEDTNVKTTEQQVMT